MAAAGRPLDVFINMNINDISSISEIRMVSERVSTKSSDYRLGVIHFLAFLPARRYASAGYRDRNVSVRPSRAGIVSKRRKLAA